MQPTDDRALLRQYVENGSDEAFAALVTRHVNLVYSVALRHAGQPHNAEEITQAVFIILAKKAAQLRHDKALSSWLFQATRLTAANFVRSESRRHHREQEAHMQSVLNEPENETWPKIAPLLDTAVAALREPDRRAIVLRYYEGRNLREVGLALGASEEAAGKRVSRALEKLRKSFLKRGIISTTAVIAGAISANSVHAAPAALANAAAAAALAKGATASASTLTLIKGALKLMAWTKAKTAIVVGAVVLLAGAPAVVLVEKHLQARQFVVTRGPWSDEGAATPKAALQTLAWALTHDNSARADELMQWDEKGAEFTAEPKLQRQMLLMTVLAPAVQDLKSFRIQSIEPTKQPDEVRVKLEKNFKRGINEFAVTTLLRRTGSQWRIVGDIEFYENGNTSMRLPFMGSF